MKLTELEQIVIIESGQFLLGSDLTAVSLDLTKFWVMVKRALNEYGKWRPVQQRSQIQAGMLHYTFTVNTGVGIPDWVSSVVPVTSPKNPLGMLAGQVSSMEQREFLWEYRSPDLYLTETGIFDIVTVHKPSSSVTIVSNVVTEVDLPDLSDADLLFIDLVVSRFLQAVGKSRRAFTLSELPIETDASEIVSEGNDLYEKTMEELRENNSWYLGVGG